MDRFERQKIQEREDKIEKHNEETMDEIRLDKEIKEEYNKEKKQC